MKKKALNVNRILLLLSSLTLLIITSLPSSDCIQSSDSSLNQLSSKPSRTSSPSQSYDKFFYQTLNGGLPLDREVTVYVLSGEAKRLYYQIHGSKPEIALTVTPCESTIEWKLSFLPQKIRNKDRKTRHRRRYKRRHNKHLAKHLLNNSKPLLLTNYLGNERTTYSDVSSSPGLYIIDINSMGRDVSVKVFVSQHYPYPLLPNEPDIDITSVMNDRVLINWHQSPSEVITPIEYCVSVSSKKHFADNCLLESQLKDSNDEEYELDLLPSVASTSFAYWWGQTVKNMLKKSRLKSIVDHNLRIECVGKKTSHLLAQLDNKHNDIYFIDVFARNTITNATSMYRTINVTLINTEPMDVNDSQQIVINLNQTNNFRQLLHYKSLDSGLGKEQQKLWLFINPCTGFGALEFTISAIPEPRSDEQNSSHLLFRENLFVMKSMEILIERNQTTRNQSLSLEISSSIAADRSAVFFISKRHNKYPFPLLPDDTKIKVMETLTDCNGVTLAWNASPDDKVLYCIYQRKAHNHYSFIEPIDDVCTDNQLSISDDQTIGANPVQKVLCKRYHKSSKRRFNNKIIQTIKRLSSGQRYVFQVMITKYKGRTLTYEQVWVSTKPKYQCN